jgi:hypothetical protein
LPTRCSISQHQRFFIEHALHHFRVRQHDSSRTELGALAQCLAVNIMADGLDAAHKPRA